MSSRRRTPMVCPICGNTLSNVQILQLGGVTASLNWEMHSGHCAEHGWFQAEMISTPPREIFPVKRPGGSARKLLIAGRPVYSFPTIWDTVGGRRAVDAYDRDLWAVDWSRLPGGVEEVVLTST